LQLPPKGWKSARGGYMEGGEPYGKKTGEYVEILIKLC